MFWIALILVIAVLVFIGSKSRNPVRGRGRVQVKACDQCGLAPAHCRHRVKRAETASSFGKKKQ